MSDDSRHQVAALRAGDELTVKRLSDLARTLVEVLALLDEIHGRGARVVETSTGRRSDKHAVEMIRDSLPYLRKGMTRRKAKEVGAKGGRPKAQRETTQERAEAIWFNTKRYKTNRAAVAAMKGWSLAAAFKTFGASGRDKTGRPKRKPNAR